MFNYNATDLPLSLSQAQKDALKQYTADFKELMERKQLHQSFPSLVDSVAPHLFGVETESPG